MASTQRAYVSLTQAMRASSSRQHLGIVPGRVASSSLQLSKRNLATTSKLYAEADAASSSSSTSTPVPSKSGTKAAKGKQSASDGKAATPISSCPAGTVLTGLAVYKDRADPVALPDSEYPDWLWNILDDKQGQTVSGITLESTTGMSKGEARAAQKRNLRLVKAAQRSEERERQRARTAAAANVNQQGGVLGGGTTGTATRQVSTSGAGMHVAGTQSQGTVATPMPGSAEALAGEAAAKVMTPAMALEAERAQRRVLRKANREAIKARNFVKK